MTRAQVCLLLCLPTGFWRVARPCFGWFMDVHGLILAMVDTSNCILLCVEFDDATRLTWLACNPLLSSGNLSTDGWFPFFSVFTWQRLDQFWWIRGYFTKCWSMPIYAHVDSCVSGNHTYCAFVASRMCNYCSWLLQLIRAQVCCPQEVEKPK